MKRKMCKLTAVLLACVMALSGCGKGGAEKSGKKSSEEGMPNLIIMMLCPSVPQDADMVQKAVSEITEKEIGATVTFQWMTYGEYTQKLSLLYSNPDEQLDASFDFYPNGISSYVSKGQLLPIGDLLDQYGQGIKEVLGEEYLKAGQIEGEQYTLTTKRDLAKSYGIVFRKDIIENLGIDVSEIKSEEDLTSVFEKIHNAYPEISIVSTPGIDGWATHSMIDFDNLGDFFGVLENPDELKVTNYYTSEKYEKRLKLMREWNQAGYIYPGVATDTESQCYAMMKAGTLASYFIAQKPGIETQESIACGTEVVAVPLTRPLALTSNVQASSWALPINCKYPEKTMEYLNLVYTSPELMNLLTYGIEGTHYQVLEDGRADYPDGVTSENCGYSARTGWMYGNQPLTHVWVTDEPDLWEQLDTFNQESIKSKAMGFAFDSSAVKTEFTALTNVVQKYEMSLEWGFVDPESELPKFQEELEKAGIDKYIAEKQNQLDQWAADNKAE